MPDKMNKSIKIKGKKFINCSGGKKGENFKAKLGQIQTAYSNKEAKNFYREVNSIRKGFKPQKLLITD
jgi:hypothetical protein